MSGGGLGYAKGDSPFDSPLAGAEAVVTASPTAFESPSPNPGRTSRPPSAGTGAFAFPRGSPASTPGHGHARRTSSISYSSSRDPDASPQSSSHPTFFNSYNSSAAASPSPAGARRSHYSPSSSPTLDRFRGASANGSLASNLGGLVEENGQDGRRSEEGREREHSAAGSASSASGFLSSSRTGASIGAQPTLTELNSDLLNFIAKKERKCLDLREELKRHEEELQHLKKKWENIVAKSLASSSPPTTTSLPRPSVAAEAKRFSRGDVLPPLPYGSRSSNSPRPAPTHTLDLSLLSSTFDPTSFDSDHSLHGQDIDLEIGESVQAAKAWVGGVFGKLLDSVSGIDDQLPPIPGAVITNDDDDGRLDVLREEEEDEHESSESRAPLSPERAGKVTRSPEGESSAASASSTDDNRRDSRGSTLSSASVDSSSSFFGFPNGATTRPRSNSGGSGATVVVPAPTSPANQQHTSPASPTASVSSVSSIFSLAMGLSDPSSSPDLSPAPPAKDAAPRPRSRPAATNASPTESGHARRRSTFDVLGAAAGGGWKSLSTRWTAVQESETFKGTKRSALGLVDQFERTLTETLGPLDPPGTPPLRPRESLMLASSPLLGPSDADSTPVPALVPLKNASSWSKTAPLSAAAKKASPVVPQEGEPKTPKQSTPTPNGAAANGSSEWDWTAFLDGVAPTPSSGSLPSPHIGGYRRPSHTLAASAPAPKSRTSSLTGPPLISTNSLSRSTSAASLLDDDSPQPFTSPALTPSSPSVVSKSPRERRTSHAIKEVKEDENDDWGHW
ncbi:hypothetical protein RQP46_005482 [Phenoliferia psychrophenolica]